MPILPHSRPTHFCFVLAAYRRPCLNRRKQENSVQCPALAGKSREEETPMATSSGPFVKVPGASAAAISAPGLLKAQTTPSKASTVRAVLHGDLKIFDPIWTTANMTGNHGLLIYDTLFGLDDARNVQPQ